MFPHPSWDADSHLWFRIQEWDGVTEKQCGAVSPIPYLISGFHLNSAFALIFDPSDRTQNGDPTLFKKSPAGTSVYVDDLFATVSGNAPESGWPVNAVKRLPDQVITIDGSVTTRKNTKARKPW